MSSSVGANYCLSNVFVKRSSYSSSFFETYYEAEWMNNTE